jgi:type 2 lantibiotic biosynthesis protein LanM
MALIDQIRTSSEIKKIWTGMLGEELIEKVLAAPEDYVEYACVLPDSEHQAFLRFVSDERTAYSYQYKETDRTFEPFFDCIDRYIRKSLLNRCGSLLPDEQIRKLTADISERLTWPAMRCLIQEMHDLKQAGRLHGKNSEEEYQYYLKEYLNTSAYLKMFFEKYPVMMDLIIQKTHDYTDYVLEVMQHLQTDREDIINDLCHGKSFESVVEIKMGLSDEHAPGRTVARVKLDNGDIIFHKPHDLTTSICYQEMYAWLLNQCKMAGEVYPMLNRNGYGWEAEIKNEPCKSISEVADFYKRTGVQICLAYLLGVTDIHFENLIAHGAHPVIIDLEFMADRRLTVGDHPRKTQELLADSVINTGILPVHAWHAQHLNMGALGEMGEQRSPIQMPYIVNTNSSDMAVAYACPSMHSVQNMPELNGEKIDFKAYVYQILEGFEIAYHALLAKKKLFCQKFESISGIRSRHLIRNTQEYFMYQNSLNFPDFMRHAQARQLMLVHMDKGLRCNEKYRQMIRQYEMACIYHAIIPVFYADGNDLYTGNGTVMKDYFSSDGKSQILRRLNKLSEEDMRLQMRIMEADFLSYVKVQKGWMGKIYTETAKVSALTPAKIAEVLMREMYQFEDRCTWLSVQYNGAGKTFLGPVDDYLYSGICGITIFFAALCRNYHEKCYKKVFEQLERQIFQHIEQLSENHQNIHSWGLFTGETSYIYTCHILYRMTGKNIYLEGAQKQGGYLLHHLDDLRMQDVLEGRAGVLITLLLLYEDVGEQKWLDAAKVLGNQLMTATTQLAKGVGWPEHDRPALAGMAHGNSGIAMALALLWKYTKENAVINIIQQAIAYEDCLYDPAHENWMDIRDIAVTGDAGRDMVAWCHGAGGIFAARMKICALTGLPLTDLFRPLGLHGNNADEVIQKISVKMAAAKKTDMCLCHGGIGLGEILGQVAAFKGTLSFEDRNSQGLMTGLSGIGYALLHQEDHTLPQLLDLI